MKQAINGTRIKQAREVRGDSLEEFAAKIGCSTHELVRYEANLSETPQATAERVAIATGFSIKFFRQSDPPNWPLGSLLFHDIASRCHVCKKRAGECLCDWPTGKECSECFGNTDSKGFHVCRHCLGSGIEPCSKPLCASCTVTNGLPTANINRIDHCPEHAAPKRQRASAFKRAS